MKPISQAIQESKDTKRHKNQSREFQQYGSYLAESLEDLKHCSLYIKLAKELPRPILEEALTYTKGYTKAKSKAKIFMWRLKKLRQEIKT